MSSSVIVRSPHSSLVIPILSSNTTAAYLVTTIEGLLSTGHFYHFTAYFVVIFARDPRPDLIFSTFSLSVTPLERAS